jgi:hypothetical protein
VAISCDTALATPTGPMRADTLAASAPKQGWQRLSCGKGSKGHRVHDWLLVELARVAGARWSVEETFLQFAKNETGLDQTSRTQASPANRTSVRGASSPRA